MASFGASTRAEEVTAGVNLHDKLVVITGATSGLGEETARVLAAAGADVFLGARGADALKSLVARAAFRKGGEVFSHPLDLTDSASIDAFADDVLSLGRPVDVLINNAGIMACPLSRTKEGFESQLGVNFIGHAVLTSRLADALKQSGVARLVSLSSLAHHRADIDLADLNFERRPYDPWIAYGQSKTANVLLAVHAQTALARHGVACFAIHPGIIPATGIQRFQSEEDRAKAAAAAREGRTPPSTTYKTIAAGAATSVWAVVNDQLSANAPAYLEDCTIADIVEKPNFKYGVCRYALDVGAAERLWKETERLLGRRLPL